MKDRRRGKVALALSYAAIEAVQADEQAALCCLNCREPLAFHQPDTQLPSRLIATCADCRCWYLVECAPEWPEALLVLLPDARTIRDLNRLSSTA